MSANGQQRAAIRPGLLVDIVLKKDQASGQTTRGVVKDILTNSANHPHGIKVRLQSGDVGRVKTIVDSNS
ncbi:YwbE family protein [Paenibacillus sepulcri]|uniref:YwbE family protein n=1 Tax=Paenibacillus sepulcri TaxID=359917 RepID=A0ABS7CAX7_9BACL|nr:YwbE family protein [Paenibacillus sepulcri]